MKKQNEVFQNEIVQLKKRFALEKNHLSSQLDISESLYQQVSFVYFYFDYSISIILITSFDSSS